MSEPRPPLPPFTAETARVKVRLAEDAWNAELKVEVAHRPQTCSARFVPRVRRWVV